MHLPEPGRPLLREGLHRRLGGDHGVRVERERVVVPDEADLAGERGLERGAAWAPRACRTGTRSRSRSAPSPWRPPAARCGPAAAGAGHGDRLERRRRGRPAGAPRTPSPAERRAPPPPARRRAARRRSARSPRSGCAPTSLRPLTKKVGVPVAPTSSASSASSVDARPGARAARAARIARFTSSPASRATCSRAASSMLPVCARSRSCTFQKPASPRWARASSGELGRELGVIVEGEGHVLPDHADACRRTSPSPEPERLLRAGAVRALEVGELDDGHQSAGLAPDRRRADGHTKQLDGVRPGARAPAQRPPSPARPAGALSGPCGGGRRRRDLVRRRRRCPGRRPGRRRGRAGGEGDAEPGVEEQAAHGDVVADGRRGRAPNCAGHGRARRVVRAGAPGGMPGGAR